MTDRERAAALADEIERFGAGHEKRGFEIEEEALIARALRAYSAPVSTDAELREAVAIGMRQRNHCGDHLGCENRGEELGCACRNDADAAISAIHASGWRIVPAEAIEEIIEVGAMAKLNHERAVNGLMPCLLSDLDPDDADLYRMDASIVLRAALAAKEPS